MMTPKRTGRRVTVELDELDCELIVSALRIAGTTRALGRKLAKVGLGSILKGVDVETPKSDEREKRLIELLTIRNS